MPIVLGVAKEAAEVAREEGVRKQLRELLDEMHEEGGRVNYSDYMVLSGLVKQLEPRRVEEKDNPLVTSVVVAIDDHRVNPVRVRLEWGGKVVDGATGRIVGTWERASVASER